MSEVGRAGFWHGVFAGFAGLIVVVHVALSNQLADLAAMYRDFGEVKLSLLTRITLHPAWIWGTPLVGAGLVGLLLWKKPRAYAWYVAVAIVVLVVAAMTYYYPRAPLYALAGNIRAD